MAANAEESRNMFLFLFSSSFSFNASVHTVAWLGSDGLLAPACLLHLPIMSFKSFFGRAYYKEKKKHRPFSETKSHRVFAVGEELK